MISRIIYYYIADGGLLYQAWLHPSFLLISSSADSHVLLNALITALNIINHHTHIISKTSIISTSTNATNSRPTCHKNYISSSKTHFADDFIHCIYCIDELEYINILLILYLLLLRLRVLNLLSSLNFL